MKWIFAILIFASSQAYGDFQQDLNKAVSILNQGVSTENQIILPTDPAKYLNSQLPGAASETEKSAEDKLKVGVAQLRSLSQNPDLECSALASPKGLPAALVPILKATEVINKEILAKNSWSEAISYTSMMNKLTFCKNSFLEKMLFANILNTELETLAKLDASKLTSQEKERLKKLKTQIAENLQTASLVPSLQAETLIWSAYIVAAEADVQSFSGEAASNPVSEFLFAMSSKPKITLDFSKISKLVRELYDFASTPNTTYNQYADKAAEQRQIVMGKFIETVGLKDSTLAVSSDFDDPAKVKSFLAELKKQPERAKKIKASFNHANVDEFILVKMVYPLVIDPSKPIIDVKLAKSWARLRESLKKLN